MPVGLEFTVPPPVPAFSTCSWYWLYVKFAVTERALVMLTVHVPVPVQAPPHPVNVDVPSATAASVTRVPWAKGAPQVAPHVMPAGAEVTVPPPVPTRLTNSVYSFNVKFAVTVAAAVRLTVQVPVPVQPPPLHPANVEPALAEAVRVTLVPSRKLAEQVEPHEMPAGDEVTVPTPVPVRATESVYCVGSNVAVTVVAAVMLTAQVPVPLQPPLHPVKVEPGLAVAVNATTLPSSKGAAQVVPQVMPAGTEVTVPLPAPLRTTVSVRCVRAKVAMTVRALVGVTVQVPVPGQLKPAPLQPVKVEPGPATAVSTTALPWSKSAAQVAPQVMPAGDETTVPEPAPAFATLTV